MITELLQICSNNAKFLFQHIPKMHWDLVTAFKYNELTVMIKKPVWVYLSFMQYCFILLEEMRRGSGSTYLDVTWKLHIAGWRFFLIVGVKCILSGCEGAIMPASHFFFGWHTSRYECGSWIRPESLCYSCQCVHRSTGSSVSLTLRG